MCFPSFAVLLRFKVSRVYCALFLRDGKNSRVKLREGVFDGGVCAVTDEAGLGLRKGHGRVTVSSEIEIGPLFWEAAFVFDRRLHCHQLTLVTSTPGESAFIH